MNGPFIDVNASVSRWPTRRLRDDEPAKLAQTMQKLGIVEAWVGSLEGLLHKDVAGVNARLAADCGSQREVKLIPFGTVNPKQPDWEEDLRRCAEVHRMPGIRVHPNYHGYALDDGDFAKLCRLAAERKLIVQLVVLMEDERMMHPLLRVPPVNLGPLAAVLKSTPGLTVVLLNALKTLKGEKLADLIQAGNVFVEPAMLEGTAGIEAVLKSMPVERLLLGTNSPLFYPEAALMKLTESALAMPQRAAISSGNARRLLAGA